MTHAFSRLQASAAGANFADGMSVVTFPMLAASFTSSPLAIGAISAARMLPWLLASVHVGALIDRKGPARLLYQSDAVRVAIFLMLILVLLFHMRAFLPCLALVAFSIGVLEVVADNSAQTLVPTIVPPEILPSGNARMQLIENTGVNFVGPPVASALMSVSMVTPLLVIAANYSLAAAVIRKLGNGTWASAEPSRAQSLLAGWTHIRRSRALFTLAASTSLMNLATTGAAALFVLYVKEQLHAPAWTYGLLLTALTMGAFLGAAATPRALARTGESRVLRSVLITMPVPMLLLAVATSFWLAAAAQVAVGALETAWGIVTVSFRQEVAPRHLLGRVNAVYRMIAWGSIPIGAFFAGVVAQLIGIRATYLTLTAVLCTGWLVSFAIRPRLFEHERQTLSTTVQREAYTR